jgi:hypothetical protein
MGARQKWIAAWAGDAIKDLAEVKWEPPEDHTLIRDDLGNVCAVLCPPGCLKHGRKAARSSCTAACPTYCLNPEHIGELVEIVDVTPISGALVRVGKHSPRGLGGNEGGEDE